MKPTSRSQQLKDLFPNEPAFRLKQINQALFDPTKKSWSDITTLSKSMRETLEKNVPWISVELFKLYESKNHDTFKAILKSIDGKYFETVLMANKKGQWTICVSSQIGCAMRCTFCATGTMGLKRSLLADEIIDQYRFWLYFLHGNLPQPLRSAEASVESAEPLTTRSLRREGSKPIPLLTKERRGFESREPQPNGEVQQSPLLSKEGLGEVQSTRISNVVFMGMGEPLANYEHVKETIHTWLTYTDLGKTKITISTVGILTQLTKLLTDPDWPDVRIAISLHSANQKKREEIVPTTVPEFLQQLAAWSQAYHKVHGNRKHHVTYEYTLINGVNDTPALAEELARYIKKTAVSKINVIPLNPVAGKPFERSHQDRIDQFKSILRAHGLTVTQRKTMGDDIAAACGQLVS